MAEGGVETRHSQKDIGQFQLVDYGDQLVKDVEEMRDELHKQALSLAEKQHRLWEVVRTLTVLILPVTSGLGLAVIAKTFLPTLLANSAAALFLTASLGFVLLNLPQLNDAVNAYLEHKLYKPSFADCQCEKCAATNAEGAGDSDGVGKTIEDIGKVDACVEGSATGDIGNGAKTNEACAKADDGIRQTDASGNAIASESEIEIMAKCVERMKNDHLDKPSINEELTAADDTEVKTGDAGGVPSETQTTGSGSSDSIGILNDHLDVD